MKPSESCLALIRRFEGLRLKAYPDPASGGEPFTIGYGHTGGVHMGDTCTVEQAEAWLAEDALAASQAVLRLTKVELTQGELDALTSFVFNLGAAALAKSNLLRLLNLNEPKLAAAEFLRWTHGGGKVMPGLVKRRQAERAMFLGEPDAS